MKAIVNARFVLPDQSGKFYLKDGGALLYDEKIIAVADAPPMGAQILDARGNIVSPGFINIHVHGAAGFDTMDATESALGEIARFLSSTGVTSFCPTTMTAPTDKIKAVLKNISAAKRKTPSGARIIGAHLEGPFISREKAGAQDRDYITKPNLSLIEEFSDALKIITLAPEAFASENKLDESVTSSASEEKLVEGAKGSASEKGIDESAERFIARCRELGITVSLGHSNADYETSRKFFTRYDATNATHLGNAMSPLTSREPGLFGAALDLGVYTELIVDGVHLHEATVRLIHRLKGEHIILITDAIRATGQKDGVSELGGQTVFVKNGAARLLGGTLAGSVLTLNKAVKNFCAYTGASLAEAIELATKTPAKSIGLYNELGSIEKDKRADLTIFDDTLDIKYTIVDGRIVYERK